MSLHSPIISRATRPRPSERCASRRGTWQYTAAARTPRVPSLPSHAPRPSHYQCMVRLAFACAGPFFLLACRRSRWSAASLLASGSFACSVADGLEHIGAHLEILAVLTASQPSLSPSPSSRSASACTSERSSHDGPRPPSSASGAHPHQDGRAVVVVAHAEAITEEQLLVRTVGIVVVELSAGGEGGVGCEADAARRRAAGRNGCKCGGSPLVVEMSNSGSRHPGRARRARWCALHTVGSLGQHDVTVLIRVRRMRLAMRARAQDARKGPAHAHATCQRRSSTDVRQPRGSTSASAAPAFGRCR